ncbi:alpha/beta hydrolase [Frigidibacter sp. MR17.24]|uniref:alpha/beta hydrolase n=1 Tax=Frigidibacter sp. MR17.24 TaxID=3127345 RepID=UPI003012A7D6
MSDAILRAVSDWDNLYNNAANIPSAERWPGLWVDPAKALRDRLAVTGRARLGLRYGPAERNRYDLFLPEGTPAGLVVYVHGGFWMGLDESFWSQLSAGPLAHGWAVAMPTYSLAPAIRIAGITAEIGAAIAAAAGEVAGPIRLAGHSAGGHLVARMACTDAPLPPSVAHRLAVVVSISGLHDLRPLLHTRRNSTLGLDPAEAAAESPALLAPRPGTRLVAWAGQRETSEFLRQNRLLPEVWRGLGAATACVEEPDRHHFTVVDGLADPDHPLTRTLITA